MKDSTSDFERFRTRLRKSLATATGPRRDEPYVLSTVLWVELVKSRSECSTYYGLECLFEPGAFGKNVHGDPYHFNKWPKYAIGLARPSKALVARVDRKIRGSARLLQHPLWEILRENSKSNKRKESWLGRLSPDVQRIVLEQNLIISATGEGTFPTASQLQMLERRAGIDSLAYLSLLLVEALESEGQTEVALSIAQSLYRVLLMTCVYHPFINFADELFDCFRRRLLARVQHAGQRFGLELINFSEATLILLLQVLRQEDSDGIGATEKEKNRGCLKVLDGKCGFDLKFALNPPLISLDPSQGGDDDEGKRRSLERSRRLWEWGLQTIRSGEVKKFPPTELL